MYPHHVFNLEPAGTFGMYPICYRRVGGRYFQPEPAIYSRCFRWFPGPLAPSESMPYVGNFLVVKRIVASRIYAEQQLIWPFTPVILNDFSFKGTLGKPDSLSIWALIILTMDPLSITPDIVMSPTVALIFKSSNQTLPVFPLLKITPCTPSTTSSALNTLVLLSLNATLFVH